VQNFSRLKGVFPGCVKRTVPGPKQEGESEAAPEEDAKDSTSHGSTAEVDTESNHAQEESPNGADTPVPNVVSYEDSRIKKFERILSTSFVDLRALEEVSFP
jgi:hypothetical protein